MFQPTGRTTVAASRVATAVPAVVGIVATIRLAWAFLTSDLTFEVVAAASRRDSPWYYRIAGLWGSAEGSLLLFASIVAVVGAVATRREGLVQRLVSMAFGGALLIVAMVTSHPFRRLDIPALDGAGLTPILEHWAMAVHPPLLYAGLAAMLPPFFLGWGPGRHDRHAPTRRWLLAGVGLLTAAMALGGVWSYVEQGWGGYWAWDPIENTSLIPWLLGLSVVHLGDRSGRVGAMMPWVAVLWGSALTRSGSATSVHSFAERPSVTRSLIMIAAASTAAVVVVAWLDRNRADRAAASPVWTPRRWAATVFGILAALVVVGTATGPIAELAGHSLRIRGEYFARVCAPLAVLVAASLVWAAANKPVRRTMSAAAWLAHVGAVVLLCGIAASAFDRQVTVPVETGATVEADGFVVTNRGVDIVAGPRRATQRVRAELVVDGLVMRPSIDVYPELGGRLAETAVVFGPWLDRQATLLDAADGGAVTVEVRRRPLTSLIWMGAALVSAGSLLSRRTRRPGVEPASPPAGR